MFSLILTIIMTSLPLLTKTPLIITPVPSTLKVNAPSDIKKQLLIIWYPVSNWSPPPNQYFIKRQKKWNSLSPIMGSLTILLMNKLNVWLKMLTKKINTVLRHPVNKHISNFFNYKKYSRSTTYLKHATDT